MKTPFALIESFCAVKWWVWSSSARASHCRQTSSFRPISIIRLRNVSSRMNLSWFPGRTSSYTTSSTGWPYYIPCLPASYHIDVREVVLSWTHTQGPTEGPSYSWWISDSPLFLYARSARMCSGRCQRPSTTDMLCTVLLGSTSTISHSSVFPAALIASRDSLLNGLNARCCWRSLWSACRWGWFSIFCIKFWTLTPCDRFTVEFGTLGMLKSMFSSPVARLNSLSALNDAMSRCSAGKNCSFTMCVLALDFTCSPVPSWAWMTRMSSDFTSFPVLSEEPSSFCKRLSSISCERDVFPFSTKTRSVSSGFPDRSQIGLRLS